MKLIYCPECDDVLKLNTIPRLCKCQQSGGQYLEDDLHAEYWGKAVPLGFANPSFVKALQNRPEEGDGERFRWQTGGVFQLPGESFLAVVALDRVMLNKAFG